MQRTHRQTLLIGGLALSALLAGCGRPSMPMPRDNFASAVIGKSPSEVIGAVGSPDETAQRSGEDTWLYRGKTTDPATGEIGTAIVVINEGRVTRVAF